MESGQDYFQNDSADDSMEFQKKLEESYQVRVSSQQQHLEKSSSKASNRVGTAKLRPNDRQRSSKSLRRDSSIVQGSGVQSLQNPIPVVQISEPNTKEATAREEEQKSEDSVEGEQVLQKFVKFVEKSQIKPGEFGKMNHIGMSEFRLCFKKLQYQIREEELEALWDYVNPKGLLEIPMKQFINSVSAWSKFHVKRAQSVHSATSLDISKPVHIVRNLSGTGNERKFPKNRTAYFLKQAKLKEQEADRALKMALDKGRRELEFDCLHKMGEACEIARELNLPVSFSAFKGADGSLKIHFIRLESGAINEENQVQEKQLITIEEFLREYKRLKRNQVRWPYGVELSESGNAGTCSARNYDKDTKQYCTYATCDYRSTRAFSIAIEQWKDVQEGTTRLVEKCARGDDEINKSVEITAQNSRKKRGVQIIEELQFDASSLAHLSFKIQLNPFMSLAQSDSVTLQCVTILIFLASLTSIFTWYSCSNLCASSSAENDAFSVSSMNRMFVSTLDCLKVMTPAYSANLTPCAILLIFLWSFWILQRQVDKEQTPAAAAIPPCAIMPPSIFLNALAFWIKSFLPASIPPMGHPRPLLKQSVTLSKYCVISWGSIASAVAALKILAPSRCNPILHY